MKPSQIQQAMLRPIVLGFCASLFTASACSNEDAALGDSRSGQDLSSNIRGRTEIGGASVEDLRPG